MALIDKLQDSNLGLKGSTPEKGKGTDLSSDTHVLDPTPGSQGDEKIMFDSNFDRLVGKGDKYIFKIRTGGSNFEVSDTDPSAGSLNSSLSPTDIPGDPNTRL